MLWSAFDQFSKHSSATKIDNLLRVPNKRWLILKVYISLDDCPDCSKFKSKLVCKIVKPRFLADNFDLDFWTSKDYSENKSTLTSSCTYGTFIIHGMEL